MYAAWSDRSHWLAKIRERVPSAIVVEDVRHELWDTSRLAWLDGASDETCTHVMALQDDMIPVPNFEEKIQCLVQERPSSVISVFSIPAVLWAQEMDYGVDFTPGWRNCGPYLWGGSLVIPRNLVLDMVIQCSSMNNLVPGRPDEQVGDCRISRWAQLNKIECWHWYPQLLEHVGADHSLVGCEPAEFRKGLWKGESY